MVAVNAAYAAFTQARQWEWLFGEGTHKQAALSMESEVGSMSSNQTDTGGVRAVAIRRIVGDALTAYLRVHRISAHHPCETSVWHIPTTLLAPDIAARLARLRDGARAYRVDVEVRVEVESEGWDWSFEIRLLTARARSPQRTHSERICSITCDDGEVTVDECDPVMAAFGDTLAPILQMLVNGQFV
ncbi:MAG TPA: hypothetical protein VKQ36_02640 [Ktedonobacterales bacterium]|nr:hypothetical protein [Ktedonobacterales bacterium]